MTKVISSAKADNTTKPRTRLERRTHSYVACQHNGLKVPKDFKEWTWKKALKVLWGKSAKAENARVDFEKISGTPVPNGSFRDLITGRVAKATPKKSKKSKKISKKVAKATKKETKVSKAKKKETKVSKATSKDVGIDYDKLAKAIIKQQAQAESAKADRAYRESNDRYHSEMEIKRMGWSGQFKSEDKAIKPSSAFKRGR